jgi:WD40 repeat protein
VPVIPDHRLLQRIGRGAYGEVWLGENAFGTRRAIKVVYRDRFGDARPYERELNGIREYEPISRGHEGLVDILQVGHNATAGWFYYVMELADDADVEPRGNAEQPANNAQSGAPGAEFSAGTPDGISSDKLPVPPGYVPRTLGLELRRRGRLPVAECARLGLRLAEALAYLHGQGLAHRDIKPSNVVFVDGAPKLADPGLAARLGEPGSLVGTEGYIAPEGPGTPPADLYSLGKVLYELATGKDRRGFPDPPTDLGRPPEQAEFTEFNQVIVRACEPDPARRYPNAGELRRELLLLLAGKSLRHLRALERRVARFRRAAAVAGVVLAVLAGGWWFQHRQTQQVRVLAEESRQRLVRLNRVQGLQLLEDGDHLNALVWSAEALKLARGRSEEMIERYRIGITRRLSPTLVQAGRHEQALNHAAFSPEGRRLLTTSDDGTACVWDLAGGAALARFTDHHAPVQHGAFSPDGSRVVTAGDDHAARVWDAATGRALCPRLVHTGAVFFAWFSPDGQRIVTASADGTAKLWDAQTGAPAAPPLGHEAAVSFAAFSPDGSLVVTASADHTARLWASATGRPVGPPLRHTHEVTAAAFSPDGRRVATGGREPTVRIWDVATGKEALPPLKVDGKPRWVCFSRDGRRLLTVAGEHSLNGEARVWNALTGDPLTPPLRHASHVSHAAFSPDGRWVVTASADQTCRIWNAENGAPLAPYLRGELPFWFAEFSPDGDHLVVAGREPVWRLWRLPPETIRPTFHPAPAHLLRAFNSKTWPAATNWMQSPPAASLVRTNTPTAISPDGRRMLTVNGSGIAQVWDLRSGQPVSAPMRHQRDVWEGDFSSDGRLVVTASWDGTARVWKAESGLAVTPPLPHAYPVFHAIFSPDGTRVLTGSREVLKELALGAGEARVWSALDGRPLTPLLETACAVSDVAFSRNGKRLLTACGNFRTTPHAAWLWDADTGQPLAPAMMHPNGVSCVRFSPDERWVVTGCVDGWVRVWDAATGKFIRFSARHSRRGVSHVAFSPDGLLLATAGAEGTARIWDWATGEPVSPLLWFGDTVYDVTFSPEGRDLLVQGGAQARLWAVAPDERPAAELALICQLGAGVRLDETGARIPLIPEELLATLRQLRARYLEEFTFRPPARRRPNERAGLD